MELAMKRVAAALILASLAGTASAQAHRYITHRQYAELCAMIPQCAERRRAERRAREDREKTQAEWLATPSAKAPPIKEQEAAARKLSAVKLLRK